VLTSACEAAVATTPMNSTCHHAGSQQVECVTYRKLKHPYSFMSWVGLGSLHGSLVSTCCCHFVTSSSWLAALSAHRSLLGWTTSPAMLPTAQAKSAAQQPCKCPAAISALWHAVNLHVGNCAAVRRSGTWCLAETNSIQASSTPSGNGVQQHVRKLVDQPSCLHCQNPTPHPGPAPPPPPAKALLQGIRSRCHKPNLYVLAYPH
jgi:hypothetical protein